MSHGIIGGILGIAIAFVLDFIGVDTYVLEFLQPYLNFALNSFLVDFELQVSQDILQQFVVTDQIFEDGLTKNEFIVL